MWGSEDESDPGFHIINSSNPLIAVCDRCKTSFHSFASDAVGAAKEVKAEFDAHDCEQTK